MDLTNRERFLRLMRGEPVDRAPFAACFLAWPETLARWHREGLPEEPTSRYNFLKVVGFDFYVHQHKMPVNAFLCPRLEEEILEEDEGTRVVIDEFGTRKRVRKDGTSMPEFISFMVSRRADWEETRKLLDPTTPGRFPDEEEWKSFCTESRKLTDPRYAGGFPGGFFGGLRQLFGLEGLAYAFYDDPNLVEDVLDTLCDLWVELYSKALKDVSIDFFVPWEDMCYKAGPMLSPEMFRRYLLPRYRRLTEALHNAGVDIFFVDTDGDPRQLIDLWLEGGGHGPLPVGDADGTRHYPGAARSPRAADDGRHRQASPLTRAQGH